MVIFFPFLPLLLISSLFFPVAPAFAIPPAPWEAEELIGKPAPAFSLPDIDGKPVSLSQLKGKTIVLNFWASWCKPCRDEMPSMDALRAKLGPKGLVVLAVSSDPSKDRVVRFLEKSPVHFPVLLDPGNTLADSYKVFALPTSFVIDADGVIVKRIFGAYDWMSPESLDYLGTILRP